jgi:hypothetical protein
MSNNLPKRNTQTIAAWLLFILITIWWIALYALGFRENFHNYLFGAVYGLMALLGGLWGLSISKEWGGRKSVMGKAIIFLSLGLLAQEFGQVVFSFYNIFLNIEIPYPSIADIGFFMNIPLYLYGGYLLLMASGGKLNIKSLKSQFQAVGIPVLMLGLSYLFFLQSYEFDLSNPLKTFLDFGYPLGQAMYVSIAILAYSLTRKWLGGVMKARILLLIIAFIYQYIADFNFLYQSSLGTWYNGGYGDYLYFLAYFLMALGILGLSADSVRNKIK